MEPKPILLELEPQKEVEVMYVDIYTNKRLTPRELNDLEDFYQHFGYQENEVAMHLLNVTYNLGHLPVEKVKRWLKNRHQKPYGRNAVTKPRNIPTNTKYLKFYNVNGNGPVKLQIGCVKGCRTPLKKFDLQCQKCDL